MLAKLELTSFVIVDELTVELGPGLNVLTGETGAGKSIVVDALSLLIGARADSNLIRTGSDNALVQGHFSHDPELLSASRRLTSSGRSTARVNGEVVTAAELAATVGRRLAIHGQHAHQTLLDVTEQRRLLDEQLAHSGRQLLQDYSDCYQRYVRVNRDLRQLEAVVDERRRRVELLAYQAEEIDEANLTPGEEVELEDEARSLRNAERITAALAQCLARLADDDRGAVAQLYLALRELHTAARYRNDLDALATDLDAATTGVRAVAQELETLLGEVAEDPYRLESIERRLALIQRLSSKYGAGSAEILAYRSQVANELADLGQSESNLTQWQEESRKLKSRLWELAEQLSALRRHAAEQLAAEVTRLLKPLAMPQARFFVETATTGSLGPSGTDQIAFAFSANLGEPVRALAEAASGGELSRIMLALNVACGADVKVLVFDEVDAGLGGHAARSVGELLRRLAETRQVIVVTHQAQVAAFADRQLAVEKVEERGRTTTLVRAVETSEREAELARMLSGLPTQKALAHARELLQSSSKAP